MISMFSISKYRHRGHHPASGTRRGAGRTSGVAAGPPAVSGGPMREKWVRQVAENIFGLRASIENT
jgi:hypothetical protein